jgi:hypothetical protein
MFSGCGRWLLTIVLVAIADVPRLLGRVRLVNLERHLPELLCALFRYLARLLGCVFVWCFDPLLAHCPTFRVTNEALSLPIIAA